jgi:hypothetical protein
MTEFTFMQLEDWRIYEEVRQSGRFNMLFVPNARALTGLSRERYMFVLKNFSELKKQAELEDSFSEEE